MRPILLSLVFILGSVPAWASTVYYCTTEVISQIDNGALKNFREEKFKMAVAPSEVKFGSGGFFNGTGMEVVFWGDDEYWQARGDYDFLAFDGQDFAYSMVTNKLITAIYAKCEKF